MQRSNELVEVISQSGVSEQTAETIKNSFISFFDQVKTWTKIAKDNKRLKLELKEAHIDNTNMRNALFSLKDKYKDEVMAHTDSKKALVKLRNAANDAILQITEGIY